MATFFLRGTCHILPCPYKPCKPYGDSWILMKTKWFINLAKVMERYVMIYLESIDEASHKHVISELTEVKSIVPNSLRLSDTIFTQLSITISNGENDMEIHIDEGDIINAVFHFGIVKSGGSTLYFENYTQNIKLQHQYMIRHFNMVEYKFDSSTIYTTVHNNLME